MHGSQQASGRAFLSAFVLIITSNARAQMPGPSNTDNHNMQSPVCRMHGLSVVLSSHRTQWNGWEDE